MVFVPPSITMAQEDEPTKDWRLYTEIPSANEFMARFPPRLPLLEESGQMTKGQFLETLYRLSRFEATEPLRRAIQKYRDDPRVTEIDDVQIHAPVNVIGYNLKHIGVSCRIALLQEPSYPEFSGNPFAHLTSGSLVVLSPLSDGFTSTCLVATVLSDPVDDTASPVIELSWAHESEAIVNTNLQLVMLEPKSGYFESLCHTMLGLQQAASLNSRFDKYLFHNAENTKPPDFLRETSQNCAVSPSNAKLLDPSQLDAFKMATNRELFVVQGPPGTGKTFTSIVTVESFVKTLQACQDNSLLGASDPFPPIVIAAQTNHAVDQLLARCMESGVGEIARLGGRSQDDIISERTVAHLRRHFGGSKINQPAAAAFREHKRNLCKSFEKFHTASLLKPEELFQEGLITEAQLNSIINFEDEWETNESPEDTSNTISRWLDGYIQQREYQRAQQQEAAKQQGPTPKTTIGQAGVGKGDKFLPIDMTRPGSILKALHREDGDVWKHRAKRLLDRHSDLYEIKPAERGAVYCYLYEAFLARSETEIRTLFRLYNKNCRQVEMTRQENDISVIRAKRIQILGCTTTGLVKYRGLFLTLQPRIMLIEEAAETREGNIVASLFPSLEQLVLVGDHQQLTPHADLRELQSSPHRLNYSLFERLINMKVNYCALKVQRRMIPSLREVVQVFYPSLKDHDLVKKAEYRPRVPGMDDCPLWWFEHQWTQHRGPQFSYSNPMEADMIIGFCRYLVQSGVRPGQITILVYYMGQADLVRSKVEQDAHLANLEEKLSISTIDGFQGEENDIILLSLVRGANVTGGKARPGFVADENRAVVATSRAKRGFYIFGDAKNVLFGNRRSRETWGKVIEAFGQRKGKFIPIQCSAHGTTAKIAQPEEWRSILADGCACRLKKPRANLNSAKRPSKAEDLTAAGEQSGKPMVTDAERSTTGGKMLAKYQTSDEIMAMGMRNLFMKQSTEEVTSDSNSEGDVLISLE